MRHLNLDQFRTTSETGGVLSVSIVAQGGVFHIEAETRKGNAVLTKARSTALRQFRDATKALSLLRELGIHEAKVDTRQWQPEQVDLGRATRPDRTAALRSGYEAAAYDKWFRDGVQASLDDPRPSIAHEEVMARTKAAIDAIAAKHGH